MIVSINIKTKVMDEDASQDQHVNYISRWNESDAQCLLSI